jgi:hypothetical protein
MMIGSFLMMPHWSGTPPMRVFSCPVPFGGPLLLLPFHFDALAQFCPSATYTTYATPSHFLLLLSLLLLGLKLRQRCRLLDRLFEVKVDPPVAQLSKQLDTKSGLLIDMLSTPVHLGDSWVLMDPCTPCSGNCSGDVDNPIVYASPGFCAQTGYTQEEILGRSGFLSIQGPQTPGTGTDTGADPAAGTEPIHTDHMHTDTDPDVEKIRKGVAAEVAVSACVVSYRKDGSTFYSQLFSCPLYSQSGGLAYNLVVQSRVETRAPGQEDSNPG